VLRFASIVYASSCRAGEGAPEGYWLQRCRRYHILRVTYVEERGDVTPAGASRQLAFSLFAPFPPCRSSTTRCRLFRYARCSAAAAQRAACVRSACCSKCERVRVCLRRFCSRPSRRQAACCFANHHRVGCEGNRFSRGESLPAYSSFFRGMPWSSSPSIPDIAIARRYAHDT